MGAAGYQLNASELAALHRLNEAEKQLYFFPRERHAAEHRALTALWLAGDARERKEAAEAGDDELLRLYEQGKRTAAPIKSGRKNYDAALDESDE